jgi:hypothetical protein
MTPTPPCGAALPRRTRWPWRGLLFDELAQRAGERYRAGEDGHNRCGADGAAPSRRRRRRGRRGSPEGRPFSPRCWCATSAAGSTSAGPHAARHPRGKRRRESARRGWAGACPSAGLVARGLCGRSVLGRRKGRGRPTKTTVARRSTRSAWELQRAPCPPRQSRRPRTGAGRRLGCAVATARVHATPAPERSRTRSWRCAIT